MKTEIDELLSELKSKFGFDDSFLTDLFTKEESVSDVRGDYIIPNVGKFNFTFFDSSYFTQGVNYFRPLVRGFLVLLILLYNIRQLIGFFGYDAGVVQGRSDWIGYNRANTGGHKE